MSTSDTVRRRRRLRHPVRPGRRGPGRRRRRARHAPCTSTAHGVIDDALPGAGAAAAAGLGAAGARRTTSTCCATRCRRRSPPPGVDPADVIGIGTDFTACTMLPTLADGTPLCELAGVRRPAARLREAVEAPRRPAAGRPDQRSSPHERGEPWLPRYGGLISSEWEFAKGLQLLEEDPRGLRPRRTAGSRPPTGSCGSCAARYVRNACTAGYKGIRQDGALPVARTSSPRSTPASRASSTDKLDAADRRSSATAPARLTAEAAALDRAARGHRRRGRQRRRARHRAGRAGRRAGPDGRDHGHLDLPRDERRRAARGARHVRRRRRRHRRRAAGATRPARAASATSSAGSSTPACPPAYADAAAARGLSVHEHLTALAAAQAVGEHGLVALDWHSGNRSVLVDHELSGAGRRPDPGDPAGGRLPGAARGDRVRHPHDRRDVRDSRRAGRRSSSSPAACSKNALLMQIYADVTAPAAAR